MADLTHRLLRERCERAEARVGVLEAALREAKLEGARSLEMVRRLALYGVGEDTTPVEALATIAHYVTGKIGIRDVALGGGQEQTGADG